MTKKVEILLATYNGEKYLEEQLESILLQDYDNWVVHACDDASSDHTYEILEKFAKEYPNKFIVEKNEKGSGSAKKNFMHLLKKSSCDYVMCCDQDDVWLPNKITVTLEEMLKYDKEGVPVLVHTDLKVVDSNLCIMSESFFEHSNFRKKFGLNEVLIQNFVTGCTMMMNRPLVDLMNRVERYDDILMHDWLAAILATSLGQLAFVDMPTMLYRQHGINSVGAQKYGLALFVSKIKNTQMKKSLVDTTVQANVVVEAYKDVLKNEAYQLIQQYAEIWQKNKLKRVHFYLTNRVLKKGLPRKVCQLLIG